MQVVLFLFLACAAWTAYAVPVEGIAVLYEYTHIVLADAKITWLETGQTTTTGADGRFSFDVPVGTRVTFLFEKFLFVTTQTSTMIVPAGGLTGKYNQVVFQIPDDALWELFLMALPVKSVDPTKCHVVATVCAANKTYDTGLQGEVNSTVTVHPAINQAPFFFGVFDGLTNPFSRGLTSVSADGGVIWFNVDASDELREIDAHKPGKTFTSTKFWCRPGSFINAAPNQGPRVIDN
eukprot:TRINITY_DN16991_c0_g1_i1.p2 TRINITY_DN16991_c0_g1~~TRINITY_DN16991_c0_g1_i1.p2  ORF type:complete len:236 (-),score=66.28 TRINITY_DN16991_c0_g1_i1:200-907(-)